jgi:hypothetical protein
MLAGCASPEQAGPPTISPQLAAGWQEHTRPLINHGAAIRPGTTVWMVPNILPRGAYRVISRRGGSVEVIDGYRFDVDEVNKEIRLLLPLAYSNVEAVEEKYVKAP